MTKLAYKGGNSWDWNDPLKVVAQRKNTNVASIFGLAAVWAAGAGFRVPAGKPEADHYALYRDSIDRRNPPRIPGYVRGYIANVLKMNNVEEVAPTVTKREPVTSRRTHVFRRQRGRDFHRSRPATIHAS